MRLSELFELFDRLRPVRRRAARSILDQHLDDDGMEPCARRQPCRDALRELSSAYAVLESLPGDHLCRTVTVDDREVRLNLDYEFRELERDLICLESGMPSVVHAMDVVDSFHDELQRVRALLEGRRFSAVFADRDGTIANYCGRYRSSHQPLYAAVQIGRFARNRTESFFVVTSGPLYGDGLLCLSAFPEGTVHLAGSKGREYLLADGSTGSFPLLEEQRVAVTALEGRVRTLLDLPDYRILTMIGSGFQQKFGQLTVSRQDVHASVSSEVSQRFLSDVRGVLSSLGAQADLFELDDTGFDIELTLAAGDDRTRGFHKGDGVAHLIRALPRAMRDGPVLVCGDTFGDVPMLEYLTAAGYETYAVFVAADDDLARVVRTHVPHAVFCSAPDVLVTALGIAGQSGGV